MKRALFLLTTLVTAGGLFAADSKPYLVATRGPAPSVVKIQTVDGDIERQVESFRSVNGFAVRLTDDEVRALRNSPDVKFIEPDVERRALEIGPIDRDRARIGLAERLSASLLDTAPQTTPYGIDAISARAVWPVTRGATIRVGVIDSGIDREHPDLRERYRGGRDFLQNDDDPQDDNGHGTHVAGTIAAADDLQGVVGVAPLVELYGLRVLNAAGNGNASNVIRAIDWAIANQMHIVNLSLGSDGSSLLEEEAFDRAFAAGVLAIAATGNDAGPVGFPAAYSSVLAVGAVDRSLALASFSNTGSQVDVVAPGVQILSTYPRGRSVVTEVRIDGGAMIRANLLQQSPEGNVSGTFVFSGLGRVQDFSSQVAGKIALIRRGEITFAEKARNAKSAGAIAVVVFDNVPGGDSSSWTLGSDPFAWPLTVGISLEDGEALLQSAGVTILVGTRSDDYKILSGTSMATPHVSGVAALLRALRPEASISEIRSVINATTTDLGASGFDIHFGHGLINAEAAARMIAPERFSSTSRKLRTRRGGK
ncbi:MAG TPA: S8 family serine peptidase [Thermoanaerobaculia bacterium]|nr:S8 family serine peptidase [Thermoanaerobaculia bacterium]